MEEDFVWNSYQAFLKAESFQAFDKLILACIKGSLGEINVVGCDQRVFQVDVA